MFLVATERTTVAVTEAMEDPLLEECERTSELLPSDKSDAHRCVVCSVIVNLYRHPDQSVLVFTVHGSRGSGDACLRMLIEAERYPGPCYFYKN